ncbi:MAG: RNA polymerase factor sigma-54, partial [Gammaproteobacteria bacterium]
MKATLGLRQTQRLSMTPEMRQALGLLQMSALELRDTVQNALEHNLLLESDADQAETQFPDAAEPAAEPPGEEGAAAEAGDAEDLPLADLDSADPASTLGQGGEEDWPEPAASTGASLHEHLRAQLDLAHLSACDKAIGALLIDSINDDGY